MIQRTLSQTLLQEAQYYPSVTLLGPRQSGKTTLVRHLFPEHTYVNLENPEIRELAFSDPKTFFKRFPPPLIVDEVQRSPGLLSWIQVLIDENKNESLGLDRPADNGQFILTGSHQLELRSQITQSLAGRTSVLRLLPLSIEEIQEEQLEKENYIYQGFLPALYSEQIPPSVYYRNYFRTYVERDVRQIINLKDSRVFEQFLRLLAGRIGTELNLHSMSKQLGVSSTTLKEWLSILEASYILFLLPPFYKNYGKRIVKSPKLYFIDVGLASWLLGIESLDQVFRDPLAGNLFENMVILDLLKRQWNQGRESNLYFWRDNNQNEIDVIYAQGNALTPIEIKSSRTWNKDFAKGICYFQKIVPEAKNGILIYAGKEKLEFEKFSAQPFTQIDW
jgi:predicted AAA+ superfamily ATPase